MPLFSIATRVGDVCRPSTAVGDLEWKAAAITTSALHPPEPPNIVAPESARRQWSPR
jgi:hypothetical protein